jgi:hypothetical protein
MADWNASLVRWLSLVCREWLFGLLVPLFLSFKRAWSFNEIRVFYVACLLFSVSISLPVLAESLCLEFAQVTSSLDIWQDLTGHLSWGSPYRDVAC